MEERSPYDAEKAHLQDVNNSLLEKLRTYHLGRSPLYTYSAHELCVEMVALLDVVEQLTVLAPFTGIKHQALLPNDIGPHMQRKDINASAA